MSTGWVKVHRCLSSHDLWLSEPFTRGQAWVDLLLMANHKAGNIRRRGIGITVDRGQVGVSQDSLAARWRWSKGKVIRFLNELKREGRITVETKLKNVSVSALICITNYEQYQGDGTENGTENRTEDGTENGTGTRSKEGEEGERVELSSGKSPAPSTLADLWNSIVGEPKVLKVSKVREAKCRLRLKERDADAWAEVFRSISNSAFLRGENGRGWRADFDWIIANDTNALKVLEGKYEPKTDPAAVAGQSEGSADERQVLPIRPRRAEPNYAS